MKEFVKKNLFGLTLPQEYICLAYENLELPMKIFLQLQDSKLIDISDLQVMLGYKPLLMGVILNSRLREISSSSFKNAALLMGITEREIRASLLMKMTHTENLNPDPLVIFEGIKGRHSFLNSFQKFLQNIHYKLTAEREKNVFLDGNLYTQVKIAYSFPRKIFLISVGSKGLFNLFPTDLSGKISNKHFAVSLRSSGKANHQLEAAGRCLIAEMHSASFREVYMLGQNHMRDPVPADSLQIKLKNERSENLNLPIPDGAVGYYEIEKINDFEAGIHKIHFLKIINHVKLNGMNSTLAHIHRDYAGWRLKRGMKAGFLFR